MQVHNRLRGVQVSRPLSGSFKHTCTSHVRICDRLNTVLCGHRFSGRVSCGSQVSIVEGVTLVSLALLELNLIPA